jgi:UDP-3-O-[3-hydroxymyristoyl] glucosamine N-acyltransferase
MSKQTFRLQELADKVDAAVKGNPERLISGLSTLTGGKPDTLSFLANPAYQKHLSSTDAGAVILTAEMAEGYDGDGLIHSNPYLVYAQLSHLWDTAALALEQRHIAASATVAESAQIGERVFIDEGVRIGEDAIIADGVVLGANVVVGRGVTIGEATRLYPNVVLYHDVHLGKHCTLQSGVIIGSDGFGFAPSPDGWTPIAQLGGVRIDDHVQIGANTTIDRGALEDTVIEQGVILDNQIQVAHNVRIGRNTAIAACSAIAGSTSIGANCVVGGASGIAGHLEIVDGVHITAMTMVIKSLTEPGVYSSGTGVQPNAKWRKSIARLRQLDQMHGKIKALEKKLKNTE